MPDYTFRYFEEPTHEEPIRTEAGTFADEEAAVAHAKASMRDSEKIVNIDVTTESGSKNTRAVGRDDVGA